MSVVCISHYHQIKSNSQNLLSFTFLGFGMDENLFSPNVLIAIKHSIEAAKKDPFYKSTSYVTTATNISNATAAMTSYCKIISRDYFTILNAKIKSATMIKKFATSMVRRMEASIWLVERIS